MVTLLILSACSVTDKYSLAYDFYMKSNYVVAIQLYDDFLENHEHTAMAVKSKLERSDCYYQLGYKAYKKRNWILASRLFFLANSEIADNYLDNCYYQLSEISKAQNDIDQTLEYYNKITSYLENSELIPEVLFNRINIYLERDEKYLAFQDYHFLWSNYPDNQLTKRIQPDIDQLLPHYLQQAISFKENAEYDKALDLLFKLNQYPTSIKDQILDEISAVYLLKAEVEISRLKLPKAKIFYDSVLYYSPEKKKIVQENTAKTCDDFIAQGNDKIDNYEFDEAISTYSFCFDLIENYQAAEDAINLAREQKKHYQKALEFQKQAKQYEDEENYTQALNYYRKSYSEYELEGVQEKIFIMANLKRAEAEPKKFALDIMLDYRNGRLSDRLLLIYEEQKAIFGEDLVSSSGWRVSYAAGEYKFEVRYDILTPDANYYYAWRVDLKHQKISPSNKISEDLMKK